MKQIAPALTEIAAVDLGSNSFRLQMAHLVDGQMLFHDSLREMVRLGAGLGKDKMLDEASQQRAIDCLRRFSERLRGLPPHAVRAVATNTFRVARNAPQLLEAAQEALGFPIEIIGGREEARMIFMGVSHALPQTDSKRLVIDIGGGSTEFIIGTGLEPRLMESLYMGCVSYSMRFFPDGKLTEDQMKKAEISARAEIQGIRRQFSSDRWSEALGSSGTARALGEILRQQGWSDGSITREGLMQLRAQILKAKDTRKLKLQGLSAERTPSFPGGFAIMLGAFHELKIDHMAVAAGALREGVLHELVGRMQHQDTREATVARFRRRYHVDAQQVKRVKSLAIMLLDQVAHRLKMDRQVAEQYLIWASRLHEIGISIAHSGYHKHSAYIIENADMPGFSRMEQQLLGLLLRCQRRSLPRQQLPGIDEDRCVLIAILRLAVLLCRNRTDADRPPLWFDHNSSGFRLQVETDWLELNPLTDAALTAEVAYWKDAGVDYTLS